MSFVFLYKLKGKRVAFRVLNILCNFFLFLHLVRHSVLYGTVYCMVVYCVAQFTVWHSVLHGTVY
jgi:uncharacterized membrane protein YagU involved in acid resistance